MAGVPTFASDPDLVWTEYSDAWSDTDAKRRGATLTRCLADDVTYRDPNGIIEGRDALSAYMAGYQTQTPPGSRFRLDRMAHHHQHSLTNWRFVDSDEAVIYSGASFATRTADGKLRDISGFFFDVAHGEAV